MNGGCYCCCPRAQATLRAKEKELDAVYPYSRSYGKTSVSTILGSPDGGKRMVGGYLGASRAQRGWMDLAAVAASPLLTPLLLALLADRTNVADWRLGAHRSRGRCRRLLLSGNQRRQHVRLDTGERRGGGGRDGHGSGSQPLEHACAWCGCCAGATRLLTHIGMLWRSLRVHVQVMVPKGVAEEIGGLKVLTPTGTSVLIEGTLDATPEGTKQVRIAPMRPMCMQCVTQVCEKPSPSSTAVARQGGWERAAMKVGHTAVQLSQYDKYARQVK